MNLILHEELHKDYEFLHGVLLDTTSYEYTEAFTDEYYRIFDEIVAHPLDTSSIRKHPYYEYAIFRNPKLEEVCYKTFSKRFINDLYHLPEAKTNTNYMLALLTSTMGKVRFAKTLSNREQTKQVA
jgi:hypothetical protein